MMAHNVLDTLAAIIISLRGYLSILVLLAIESACIPLPHGDACRRPLPPWCVGLTYVGYELGQQWNTVSPAAGHFSLFTVIGALLARARIATWQ